MDPGIPWWERMRNEVYFQLKYSTNVRVIEGDIAGDFSERGW
jgi:hypothetical protein